MLSQMQADDSASSQSMDYPKTVPQFYTAKFHVGKFGGSRNKTPHTYSLLSPVVWRSRYLGHLLSQTATGAESFDVDLPDVDTKAFEYYVWWLTVYFIPFQRAENMNANSLEWGDCFDILRAYMLGTQFQDHSFEEYTLEQLDRWLAPDQPADVEILEYVLFNEKSSSALKDWVLDRMFQQEEGAAKVLAQIVKKVLRERCNEDDHAVSTQISDLSLNGECSKPSVNEVVRKEVGEAHSEDEDKLREAGNGPVISSGSATSPTENSKMSLSRVLTVFRYPPRAHVPDSTLVPDFEHFEHFIPEREQPIPFQLQPGLRYNSHTVNIRRKPTTSSINSIAFPRPRKVLSMPPMPSDHAFPFTWANDPSQITPSTAGSAGQHNFPHVPESRQNIANESTIRSPTLGTMESADGVKRQFTVSRKPLPGPKPMELQGRVVSPEELVGSLESSS